MISDWEDHIFRQNLIAALRDIAAKEQRPSDDFNESEAAWVTAFREVA